MGYLQFVFGRPGSGKSYYEYQKAVENSLDPDSSDEYVFIVPEQAAYQTQQNMLRLHPNHIIHKTDIFGFTRFSHKVFEENGYVPPMLLDEIGKVMVLRRVTQSLADELTVYKKSLDRPGFLNEMKSVISEMKQYKITPELLRESEKALTSSGMLRAKLHDVALIMEKYDSVLGQDYFTGEELPVHLAGQIGRNEKMKDRIFVLDGFTGFTTVQYDVIEQLLIHAKGVIICLNARKMEDLKEGDGNSSLFSMSRTVVRKMDEIVQNNSELGLTQLAPVWTEGGKGRFEPDSAIGLLEERFDRNLSDRECEWKKEPTSDNVQILCFSQAEKEVEKVGTLIRNLVFEKGYRYRDIGVVLAGNSEEYSKILENEFGKLDLPYFFDEKKSVMEHPFVHLILFVMDIFEENYSYDSIFSYLKTGLSGISDEPLLDRFENYCIAAGRNGYKKWNTEWTRLTDGTDEAELAQFNRIREAFLAETECLREAFTGRNVPTVQFRVESLYHFIEKVGAQEKLEVFAQEAVNRNQYEFAATCRQIYARVLDIMDSFVSLMGEEKISRDLFRKIFTSGLEMLKVGMVPTSLDRLIVGDMRRTRFGELKCLFVLGMNDGVYPSPNYKTGILNEQDRRKIEQNSLFELSPDGREDLFIQDYYFYLACTRPSGNLFLTYVLSDAAGERAKASYYLENLKKKLPFVKEEFADIAAVGENTPGFHTPTHDVEYLSKIMNQKRAMEENDFTGKLPEWWKGLYLWFAQQENIGEVFSNGLLYRYREEVLDAATARNLYGAGEVTSITRLEKFASCEFSHFLSYGLKVREREEYAVDSRGMGVVFHAVMERIFSPKNPCDVTMGQLAGNHEIRRNVIEATVNEILVQEQFVALKENRQSEAIIDRIKDLLDISVRVAAAQLALGSFKIESTEARFGIREELPAVDVKLNTDDIILKIQGTIDRMDISDGAVNGADREGGMKEGKCLYLNVIDYKSGFHDVDETLIREGLQLQLPIYMKAAREYIRKKYPDAEVKIGGLYYYKLDDPVVEGKVSSEDEELFEKIMDEMRWCGRCVYDENYLAHMEEPEASKISKIIKGLRYTKDFVPNEKSATVLLTDNRMSSLVDDSIDTAAKIGNRIYAGGVTVNPYSYDKKSSCTFCPYMSVCGYDKKIRGYHTRKLERDANET